MSDSVGKHSCSDDRVSLPLRVVGVVVVYELFAWKLLTDTAVNDALLIHACVDGANSRSPERFPLQCGASCASRLFLSQIIRAMSTVLAAHRQ